MRWMHAQNFHALAYDRELQKQILPEEFEVVRSRSVWPAPRIDSTSHLLKSGELPCTKECSLHSILLSEDEKRRW